MNDLLLAEKYQAIYARETARYTILVVPLTYNRARLTVSQLGDELGSIDQW